MFLLDLVLHNVLMCNLCTSIPLYIYLFFRFFWVTFQETKEPNTVLQPLLEFMPEVSQTEGIPYKLSQHVTLQNLLPDELNYFYRYAGSLTTPNCDESVVWTVLAQLVPIGVQQVISV